MSITKNPFVSGVYTALVTPFTPNADHVQYEGLHNLIRRQANAGVTGIVILGTTGESPTVIDWERKEMIRTAVRTKQENNLDIKVIIGCGTNSTDKTFHYSYDAMQSGADGVLLVNPYYNKPTQEGLYRHFAHIVERSNGQIPIMLYNIPGRTGVNLEIETLTRLVTDYPSIYAIKEASGNVAHIDSVLTTTRGVRHNFGVFSGNDALTPDVLKMGGNGVVSVVSNLVPEDVVLQYESYINGKIDTFSEITARLKPLINACFIETNPGPIKYLMNTKGFNCGPLRLPMVMPTLEHQQELNKVLDEYGSPKN